MAGWAKEGAITGRWDVTVFGAGREGEWRSSGSIVCTGCSAGAGALSALAHAHMLFSGMNGLKILPGAFGKCHPVWPGAPHPMMPVQRHHFCHQQAIDWVVEQCMALAGGGSTQGLLGLDWHLCHGWKT